MDVNLAVESKEANRCSLRNPPFKEYIHGDPMGNLSPLYLAEGFV
jgi:hypothetical protein